ncbi:MAG: carotenoid oxygenase family protein [Polyangiaceae bacterium]
MMNVETLPGLSNKVPRPAGARVAHMPSVSHALLEPGLVERDGVLTGNVPAWLQGRLLRTAPAVFELGGFRAQHWFDGLGMLYGFRFGGGRVSFAQRLLDCDVAEQARRGRVATASFASPNQRSFWRRIFEPVPAVTDNANVNVVRVGDEWLAMTESPHQLRVDDATLSVRGRAAYDDALPKDMTSTAHPHFDFARQAVVNLGTALGRQAEVIAFEHAPGTSERREIGRIAGSEAPYVHSFGLTPESVIVVGHPWTVNPLSLLWSNRGFAEHLRWRPERGTRFSVLDRKDRGVVRHFETEAFFTFHTVNSYADGSELVVDLLAYENPDVVNEFRVDRMLQSLTSTRPKLVRARLSNDGRARLERLSDEGFEFPSINYRRVSGARHRFVWGSSARGDGADVLGIDCQAGTVRRFGVADYTFGEPVFVARPGAEREDDGVLLSVGSNGEASKLAVLDAHTLEPHALLHLDLPIPLGFHGSFSRA